MACVLAGYQVNHYWMEPGHDIYYEKFRRSVVMRKHLVQVFVEYDDILKRHHFSVNECYLPTLQHTTHKHV
jgi:hypothetical protein